MHTHADSPTSNVGHMWQEARCVDRALVERRYTEAVRLLELLRRQDVLCRDDMNMAIAVLERIARGMESLPTLATCDSKGGPTTDGVTSTFMAAAAALQAKERHVRNGQGRRIVQDEHARWLHTMDGILAVLQQHNGTPFHTILPTKRRVCVPGSEAAQRLLDGREDTTVACVSAFSPGPLKVQKRLMKRVDDCYAHGASLIRAEHEAEATCRLKDAIPRQFRTLAPLCFETDESSPNGGTLDCFVDRGYRSGIDEVLRTKRSRAAAGVEDAKEIVLHVAAKRDLHASLLQQLLDMHEGASA